MALKYLSTHSFPPGGLLCYYHTGSVKNALDIVVNSHLRGSVPTQVNDPDDLRMEVKNLEKSKYLRERFAQLSGQLATSSILAKIAECVACHAKDWVDKAYRFVCMAEADKVDTDYESEDYFWQRYAQKFVGARFKFRIDSSFLIKPTAEETLFDSLSYDEKIPILECADVAELQDIRNKIGEDQFLQDLMYDKAPKWSIEHEWRLGSTLSRLTCLPDKRAIGVDFYFNFAADHLLGVDIGEAADPEVTQLLIQKLWARNIPVRTAYPIQHPYDGKRVQYQIVTN